MTNTLKQQNFRLPAEWEEHKATWLSWPHNKDTWFNDTLGKVHDVWIQIIAALSQDEDVHINVNDLEMKDFVMKKLQQKNLMSRKVLLHQFPTDDCWMRDNGPLFLKRQTQEPIEEIIITHWKFNKWGGKYPPWELDNQIPSHIAKFFKMPEFKMDAVLEGGSIDVNGKGVLLTSESCLLNKNRNPHLNRIQIEKMLCDNLGVSKILWLEEGIAGDDTDGHIDDMTRFVNETTIVTVIEPNKEDANYEPLKLNLKRLENFTDQNNKPFNIVTLPMPTPVFYKGERLPASYANFYIGNKVVLVPVFDCKQDETALKILEDVFKHRKIIPILSRDLLVGLGGIHCITMQQPAP